MVDDTTIRRRRRPRGGNRSRPISSESLMSISSTYQFLCPLCHIPFDNYDLYETHTKQHVGEKPFVCPFCRFKTDRPSKLRRHVAIHTGDKAYSCTQCKYSCIRKDDFLKHLRKHSILSD